MLNIMTSEGWKTITPDPATSVSRPKTVLLTYDEYRPKREYDLTKTLGRFEKKLDDILRDHAKPGRVYPAE